jgi:hypothetical protein
MMRKANEKLEDRREKSNPAARPAASEPTGMGAHLFRAAPQHAIFQ